MHINWKGIYNVDAIKYCFPTYGAFEDYPFGPEHTDIKMGSGMFVILNIKCSKNYISLNCDPFIAETFL